MKTDSNAISNIDEYIISFPANIQELLQQLRQTIRKAAPNATETISYAIPTFCLKGNLVHFAAFKNHLGFYPGASGVATFKDQLSAYKTSKGAVQFPFDELLPLNLISKIVKYRVKQNLDEAEAKAKIKKVKNNL